MRVLRIAHSGALVDDFVVYHIQMFFESGLAWVRFLAGRTSR